MAAMLHGLTRVTIEVMRSWKATVVNGRLVLIDETTDLPEGTHVELIAADDPDDALTAEEDADLRKALASLRRGDGIAHQDVRAALDRILKS